MRCKWVTALAVIFVVFCAGSRWSMTAQQPDPFVGNWSVNFAKSTYDPGPPPKSLNRSILSRNGGWQVTTEGVNADGTPNYTTGRIIADGKDHPLEGKGGTPTNLTVALERPDQYTVDYTLKSNGKPLNSTHGVVSKDGKTYIEIIKGANAQGKPVNNRVYWEKQ
jgi:hypothetical protein